MSEAIKLLMESTELTAELWESRHPPGIFSISFNTITDLEKESSTPLLFVGVFIIGHHWLSWIFHICIKSSPYLDLDEYNALNE